MRNPDIFAEVRFKKPEENGRHTPISGDTYACVIYVDDEGFECRIPLEGKTIQLGCTEQISILFMNPDLARPSIQVGKSIRLWEGKDVASGHIVRICSSDSLRDSPVNKER